MKCFLFFLTVIFGSVSASAQTTEDSIRTVINNLFTAMKNGDGPLLKSTFADSAILQTIVMTKEGKTQIRNEAVAEFADFVSKEEKGAADERITFDVLKIDGKLAIAWTPYQFYYKGQFSHCGVNSFQLVRLEAGWKIQYLIDTRRRKGCQ